MVKKVLFGNQKQANVINDAVAAIVTEVALGGVKPPTEEEVVEGLSAFIQKCMDEDMPSYRNTSCLRLIVGDTGARKITDKEKVQLVVTQPNDESPKRLFRVCENESAVVDEGDDGLTDKQLEVLQKSVKAQEALDNMPKGENFMERAERLKEAILPMISEGVRRDIPDNEWAQALCCAEYYYDFHKDDVPAPTPAPKKAESTQYKAPSTAEMNQILQLWIDGKSLGQICEAVKRPIEQVKYILNAKGCKVY